MLVKAIDSHDQIYRCSAINHIQRPRTYYAGKPKPQCHRGSLLSRPTPQYDEYDVSMRGEVSLID